MQIGALKVGEGGGVFYQGQCSIGWFYPSPKHLKTFPRSMRSYIVKQNYISLAFSEILKYNQSYTHLQTSCKFYIRIIIKNMFQVDRGIGWSDAILYNSDEIYALQVYEHIQCRTFGNMIFFSKNDYRLSNTKRSILVHIQNFSFFQPEDTP